MSATDTLAQLRSLRLFGMVPAFDLVLGALPFAYAFERFNVMEPWRAFFLVLLFSVVIHTVVGKPTPFSQAVLDGRTPEVSVLALMTVIGLWPL